MTHPKVIISETRVGTREILVETDPDVFKLVATVYPLPSDRGNEAWMQERAEKLASHVSHLIYTQQAKKTILGFGD